MALSRLRNRENPPDGPDVLRIWDEVRTVHLERLSNLRSHLTLYRKRNYSFHSDVLPPKGVEQQGIFSSIAAILFRRYRILILNEPTYIVFRPHLVLYCLAFRLRKAFNSEALLCATALENLNQRENFTKRIALPRGLAEIVFDLAFAFILGTFNRIVFTTTGALENYRKVSRRGFEQVSWCLFEPIPKACDCGEPRKEPRTVLFVGAFEERKGILDLLQAWRICQDQNPAARLVVAGLGHLEPVVRKQIMSLERARLIVDPPREVIHDLYREAQTVVLFSKRVKSWREQIGAPILEGLAHGCHIISSDETGLAGWLRERHHTVLPCSASAAELADALQASFDLLNRSSEVLASLPITRPETIVENFFLNGDLPDDE
jgi:glycosyltransferase involved in cell wall biosynthesis